MVTRPGDPPNGPPLGDRPGRQHRPGRDDARRRPRVRRRPDRVDVPARRHPGACASASATGCSSTARSARKAATSRTTPPIACSTASWSWASKIDQVLVGAARPGPRADRRRPWRIEAAKRRPGGRRPRRSWSTSPIPTPGSAPSTPTPPSSAPSRSSTSAWSACWQMFPDLTWIGAHMGGDAGASRPPGGAAGEVPALPSRHQRHQVAGARSVAAPRGGPQPDRRAIRIASCSAPTW